MIITHSDKPISEILKQICLTAPFIVICNKERIAFASYRPSQILEQTYPFKKGRNVHNIDDSIIKVDTPNICGILSLVLTSCGVGAIPHQNVYRPL
jgi:hypothetical protein